MNEDVIEFILKSYGYNPTKEDIYKIKKDSQKTLTKDKEFSIL